MSSSDAVARFVEQFKAAHEVLIDSYFVVDHERNIVDFNRAFFALFPRQVARGLKGRKCYEVLRLNICQGRCIAQQCWSEGKQVRLDEIDGSPAGTEKQMRFILSAIPIYDEQGHPVGALEMQRDVTDEAMVQVKYQEMLDHEARERERLIGQIRARTRELIEAHQALARAQKELLAFKKGLLV